MQLSHSPARTVTIAGTFWDEDTGKEYTVVQDECAVNPADDWDDREVALWAFREPYRSRSVFAEQPDNPVIDVFAHYYERTDDEWQALSLTRRYIAAYRTELSDYRMSIDSLIGYSQSDWLDVIAVCRKDCGDPSGHAREVGMWARGDVWIVTDEDEGDSVCDIYADSMEDAVKFFIEH